MRILQLITKDQLRGAEVFAGRLSDVLASRGHDVAIVCLYASSPALELGAGVTRMNLGGFPTRGLSPQLVYGLYHYLREVSSEIVQANDSGAGTPGLWGGTHGGAVSRHVRSYAWFTPGSFDYRLMSTG